MPDFTHPLEIARLDTLKKNKTFNLILNGLGSTHANLTTIAQIPDRCFAVTPETFPKLYSLYQIAKNRLDIQKDYSIFCNMDYTRNAKTVGTNEDCVIVIDSSCLEDFSEEQLIALIGRELGHIKMQHVSYLTAFNFMDALFGFLPEFISRFLDSVLVNVVKGLLIEWMLAAEYTADRASAIAAESIQPVMQNHLMACGIETAAESADYERYMQIDLPNLDGVDNVKKAIMTETLRAFPIPFVIPRMKELAKWSTSEECKNDFPQIYTKKIARPTNKIQTLTNFTEDKKSMRLSRGQRVEIAKSKSGLSEILIGLGWDVNKSGGNDFDLDAAVFLLGANRKVITDEDFIFYGNLKHKSGAVEHLGDNLTGKGAGDDEQIKIYLDKIPADIEKLDFTVTIYDAESRRQNFGQVENAFIRVVNVATGNEILRYDLSANFSVETAIVVAEIYAIGSGFRGGLAALCKSFGVKLE